MKPTFFCLRGHRHNKLTKIGEIVRVNPKAFYTMQDAADGSNASLFLRARDKETILDYRFAHPKDCRYTHYHKMPAYSLKPSLAAMMGCHGTVITENFSMPFVFNEETALSRGALPTRCELS